MVVDLSCAHALGTALESEGRSKPTRQDSQRPVERADSRGASSRIALVAWRPRHQGSKEGRFLSKESGGSREHHIEKFEVNRK